MIRPFYKTFCPFYKLTILLLHFVGSRLTFASEKLKTPVGVVGCPTKEGGSRD